MKAMVFLCQLHLTLFSQTWFRRPIHDEQPSEYKDV